MRTLLLLSASVAMLVAGPMVAKASPVLMLEVWSDLPGGGESQVELLTVTRELKGSGEARRLVWVARREFMADGATSLINSDRCPQLKVVLRGFPAPANGGPDFSLDYENAATIPIPPTRKDGWDYRMSWRTFEDANVSITPLPQSLYEWADRLRLGLNSCWETGEAPRPSAESH
ncbi:hypothetical protein ACIQTU_03200 [Brevundimonas sp. NPDC090276]|uniref:hypothetical protein n=1 Tax=Brevundimonas sp. NPDC090276 TaxID=3363956 RepID=UPI00383B062D